MTSHPGLDLVAQALGSDRIDTRVETRSALAEDFSYCDHAVPAAVLLPRSSDDVAAIARIAHSTRTPLQTRGGGLSYTGGYTPDDERTWLLDMRGLDRIVEINETDLYVIVEVGVTWKALDDALAPLGLRTPYWGPLSGRFATVGGALSQNSMFHGSGVHRTVAESVLGLEVIDGKGDLIRTGSWSHARCAPFSRMFGPDLTGLFLGDTGALGIKVRASLRLIKRPAHSAFLSYRCEDLESLIRAQSDVARLDIASECFGFDRRYNAGLSQAGGTVREGLAAVAKAARTGGLKGVAAAAGIAAAGKDIVQDVPFSLHVTIDAHSRVVVEAHEALVEQIARERGLSKLPSTIPTAVRASPFRVARPGIVNAKGEVFDYASLLSEKRSPIETPSPEAIVAMTVRVGFRTPRSIPLTYVRSRPHFSPNSSCDHPRADRSSRTRLPMRLLTRARLTGETLQSCRQSVYGR